MELTGLQPRISWMRSRAPYARGLHASSDPVPKRVRQLGHGRVRASHRQRPQTAEVQQECAREWTRGSYLSFPRNGGVPGSSAGVGLKSPA
jgi:hypothetical protein